SARFASRRSHLNPARDGGEHFRRTLALESSDEMYVGGLELPGKLFQDGAPIDPRAGACRGRPTRGRRSLPPDEHTEARFFLLEPAQFDLLGSNFLAKVDH